MTGNVAHGDAVDDAEVFSRVPTRCVDFAHEQIVARYWF